MLKRIIAAALAGACTFAFVTSQAVASSRFAMSCIENKTDITINYSFKWGDGSWKSYSLEPGERISHTWEYERGHEGYSPNLYVTFDDDLSGGVKKRSYVLERYGAPQKTDCKSYGKEYRFVYDGSAKKFIDLVQ
jgi:hypothetical protein